jgi:hypothetical protein
MTKAIREALVTPRRKLPARPVHVGGCVGIIAVPQLCLVLEIFGWKKEFRHS